MHALDIGDISLLFVVGIVTGNLWSVENTALPLFATGLGALGLLGWRRKRKAGAARHRTQLLLGS